MSFKQNIQEVRHILYRIKAKILYDSKAGKALRKRMWQPATEADGLKVIVKSPRVGFKNHTMNQIVEPKIKARFTWEITTYRDQTDWLYKCDAPTIIEPGHSLAFTAKNRKFITPTRSKAHQYLVPDLMRHTLHQLKGNEYTYYPALIHFDGFIGRNIYHFIDESLNPLLFLMRTKAVDLTIPFLINEQVYKLPYVQYMLALPELKAIKWVVQKPGEWIKTDCLYKCVTGYDAWEDVYELFAKHTPKKPHRRVFLNRKPKFQRRLINNDEIEAIVRKHGFEVIYAEDLSYHEQVLLFADMKYFVSMHGGGVTNVIHSDLSQLSVIEIFAEGLLNPHYYWFLEALGIHYYDAVLGSELNLNWNYSMDATVFEQRLIAMLENQHPL